MPELNLGDAFSNAANAAVGKTLSPPFYPYDGDLPFLLGAFIFEDVGVTAYKARVSQCRILHFSCVCIPVSIESCDLPCCSAALC